MSKKVTYEALAMARAAHADTGAMLTHVSLLYEAGQEANLSADLTAKVRAGIRAKCQSAIAALTAVSVEMGG